MEDIRFVTNWPALLVGRTLVVSDLHIGIEREFYRSGITIPSQTDKIIRDVSALIRRTKPERLVILGDLKHKVPGVSFQELREIPKFFDSLSRETRVEIIPGNHDTELKNMLPKNIGD